MRTGPIAGSPNIVQSGSTTNTLFGTRGGLLNTSGGESTTDLVLSKSGVVFPILIFSLIGELTFALWLTFKGVDTEKWKQSAGNALAY